jgi:hypothetical protein
MLYKYIPQWKKSFTRHVGKAYSMQGASHVGRFSMARVRGFLVQSNQDVGGILVSVTRAGDVI